VGGAGRGYSAGMPSVELTTEEIDLLAHTIKVALNGLRFEIAHTDHRDFKAELVKRQHALEHVLAALRPG
jgi:hypothetical protein